VAIEPETRRKLFSDRALRSLQEAGDAVFRETSDRMTEAALAELARGSQAVVTSWRTPLLTAALLDSLPDLGLIAHTGVSVRPYVDASLFRAGVRVTNAGDAMTVPVAEFTLMQILRALRSGMRENGALKSADWGICDNPAGHNLAATTVGVIGAGRIGRRVIRLLRAFDATVLVHDPLLTEADASAMGAARAGFDETLGAARVVTLHAPAIAATRGMIGARELALMRDGAWLVNTSRPSLLDGEALLRELRSGRLSAALDVFDREPLPAADPLRGLPNVLLSPHAAFMTVECLHRLGDAAVDAVLRFARGEPLDNEVTLEMSVTMT
jgi:phosphoglycerate dehydrogenase-like enzyme